MSEGDNGHSALHTPTLYAQALSPLSENGWENAPSPSATMEPPSAAELAMELQLERMRVEEALSARDAVVTRLADACKSIRQKATLIERLQSEKSALECQGGGMEIRAGERGIREVDKRRFIGEIGRLAEIIKYLENQVKGKSEREMLQGGKENTNVIFETGHKCEVLEYDWETSVQKLLQFVNTGTTARVLRDSSNETSRSSTPATIKMERIVSSRGDTLVSELGQDMRTLSLDITRSVMHEVAPSYADPAVRIEARNTVLAGLPIPSGIPEDSLRPIVLPAPATIHEFLGTMSGSLRTQLGNYRVFHDALISWCNEREEHGYFLTPVFKCNTNPRVTTAHRWSIVDLTTKLNKPTECFYNKDEKWYYAGVYKAFWLDELSTQEWESLSNETTSAIIKETLAGRKNTSPQTIYETGQLYAAGALKVHCVALQCIGFNNTLYRAILDQATKCAQASKWRSVPWTQSPVVCSPNLNIDSFTGPRMLRGGDDGNAESNNNA
ncbi:hypothetical protein CERSUDRAFT_140652 [Gelatoporia subvermispora B]|uniref:DUF6697 domain-containing protein n=1 Tax=Ceriporiopsis subvermispora (strain B) TaxID=914234 RepID=M2R5U1_CERS8|nr:hypothetical protein CERSUDRAFT_140652 [Gelatoporia subvermispora B]